MTWTDLPVAEMYEQEPPASRVWAFVLVMLMTGALSFMAMQAVMGPARDSRTDVNGAERMEPGVWLVTK